MNSDEYLKLFVEEGSFYNRIVLGSLLPSGAWEPLPLFFQTWLRNYIGGALLYLISGFLWCFYIYYLKRNVYLPKEMLPQALNDVRFFDARPELEEYKQHPFRIVYKKKYPQ